METLRNKVRKSKFEMVDMDKAVEILIEKCNSKFHLGITELNIIGKQYFIISTNYLIFLDI